MSSDSKQTAVEFLLENIAYIPMGFEIDIIKQAKEMEKQQNDKPIDEKLFNLANEFAVLGYGDIAVKLHSIHNGFLDNKNETYGGNK